MTNWRTEVVRATVADLHDLDPFELDHSPRVLVLEPTDAAVVLGSRQPFDVVDEDSCRDLGLAVVRRRSGGGAVVIRPSEMVWIDLVCGHGTGSMPDDVRGSMVWVGHRWATALAAIGVADAVVHVGGLVTGPWSDLVCFAGLGPGESTLGGAKLVGLSQRRTRLGLRIQGLVHVVAPRDDDLTVFRGRPDGSPPAVASIAALSQGATRERLVESLVADLSLG